MGERDEAPGDETLRWCARHFAATSALEPSYDAAEWRWLLQEAQAKAMYGPLARGVVRANGAIAGWYLYYVRPGGTAEVLQLGARPQSVRLTLAHLYWQVWRDGAVAVSGKLEPRFADALVSSRAGFGLPGYVALMHARDPDILNAVHRGDAALSRLDGEWWARFSDPGWTTAGLSAAPPVTKAGMREAPKLKSAHR
jgi:hypothetical protein